jgi:Icc-related predicted phosphoesterase
MLQQDRRDFLKLAGLAGITFTAGLFPGQRASAQAGADFHFVQFSDTHWGYSGAANPDAEHTLEKAVATVNGLAQQPDFIVFTGDLTHTTDDAKLRRERMKRFREIVSALRVKDVRFMPGEHDASLDKGEAYKEFFGATHYTFDHKGVHFIALDNVSDPAAKLGDEQLAWLAADLKQRKADDRIVVLTHRPLFELKPDWDWTTADGAKAIELLMPYSNVVVLYGHIHQENHHMTGHIAHHAAKSLIFPLPAPGSQPKRTPLPYDAAMPGLGTRDVNVADKVSFIELPVAKG